MEASIFKKSGGAFKRGIEGFFWEEELPSFSPFFFFFWGGGGGGWG